MSRPRERFFQGKRLKDFDLRELRLETGYVLQQIALFPNMTVAENIALIPEMKGLGKEETLTRMRELLTKVGLEPDSYLDRLPKDLSGGENSGSGFCGPSLQIRKCYSWTNLSQLWIQSVRLSCRT